MQNGVNPESRYLALTGGSSAKYRFACCSKIYSLGHPCFAWKRWGFGFQDRGLHRHWGKSGRLWPAMQSWVCLVGTFLCSSDPKSFIGLCFLCLCFEERFVGTEQLWVLPDVMLLPEAGACEFDALLISRLGTMHAERLRWRILQCIWPFMLRLVL